MALFHKSEEEVVSWDHKRFQFYVIQADRFCRSLWNYFPPEVGGKDEREMKENALKLQESTTHLLLPSEEKYEDIREDAEFHGIIGPRSA